MSDLLQNVLGNLPGMSDLPASEKKKMKKAIKATTEKVQSLDLESIFKTAMEGGEAEMMASGSGSKKSKSKRNVEFEKLPPPPPAPVAEKKKKKKKHKKPSPPPRTPDKEYNINLSLEELYKGETNKKLTVRVQRRQALTDEDRKLYKEHSGEDAPEDGYKYDTVKIKHPIGDYLVPGMMEDEVITFSGQADEEEGHITGDIVAEIVQDKHELFEREGNDLWILNRSISLRESYRGGYRFAHLDGRVIEVRPSVGEPLHFEGGLRRIPNAGMPIRADPEDLDDDGIVEDDKAQTDEASAPTIVGYGDLYIQFDLDLPETLSDESINTLPVELCKEFPLDEATEAIVKEKGDELNVHKVMIEKVDDPYGNEDLEDDDDDESGSDEDDSDDEEISGEETDESCSDDEEGSEEGSETGSEEEEEDEDEETGSDEESVDDEQKAIDADAAAIELLMEEQKGSAEDAARDLEEMKTGKNTKKKSKKA